MKSAQLFYNADEEWMSIFVTSSIRTPPKDIIRANEKKRNGNIINWSAVVWNFFWSKADFPSFIFIDTRKWKMADRACDDKIEWMKKKKTNNQLDALNHFNLVQFIVEW